MVKISIVGVLVMTVAILVVNVESRWWAKGKKINQCLNFCKSNSDVRGKLVADICPDLCDGIDCSGHGKCNKGRCTCDEGFEGCDCEVDLCECVDCSGRGTCVLGKCICAEGFIGNNCEETDNCTPNPCSNNGTCDPDDGSCECVGGFTGVTCQDAPLPDCDPGLGRCGPGECALAVPNSSCPESGEVCCAGF